MPRPAGEERRLRVAVTLEQCWHRVPGGTAAAAIAQTAAVCARGVVDVVGVAALHRRPAHAPWRPPVPVRHLPLPRVLLYEAWSRVRRPRVQVATGPVDVVHATTLLLPPRSAPLVVTVHDLAFRHDPAHFTARGVRAFERGLELTATDADLVLCSSAATMADCGAAGLPADRLRLVPLGVDAAPVTDADVEDVRRRHRLDQPYVLWVGTVEPRKNLSALLGAFQSLDVPHELALVGPPGWHTDLDALVAGLGGRVRVLGFVPEHDKRALMAGAAAFCYPSLSEGFGLPVLEAMAQGTPVVTSAGTATAELAGDGAGILIDPRDPADIARGLAEVLTDPCRAAVLSDAGRRRAARYTWATTAELTEAAYREAAGAA
jgi:glycosyltransferase involved in cell wall biosynthesis